MSDANVIYRMTIRLKNGRVIRRSNGRPFRIPLRDLLDRRDESQDSQK
ncbi:hypothetical protein LMG2828_00321 [Achromobacter piechaudii]|jgi:uncharacterized protein YjhX (UPF0386 family)|nr:hypothetical protein LMG2828_00321 [Achromobacter piechaudii]